MSDNRALQQNSIIRALKLLEILKSGTDRKHKLTEGGNYLVFHMTKNNNCRNNLLWGYILWKM